MTKYPIGLQNFQGLREDGYIYVDKTAFVYELAQSGKYYFLSRPRRFGKSLFLSTLEAYYQGKKDLFKGLALERLEKDWKVYPVLHLDLNAEQYIAPEGLLSILDRHLRQWERIYGKNEGDKTPADRFIAIIQHAYEQTGQKAVILVDEYDKPLLQAIGNEDLQNSYRSLLKSFYGVAKTMDSYIQMAFFTGVTKFSKVSVFSDLNNLNDISLDERFVEICGITEQEIRAIFDDDVEKMALKRGLDKETCYCKLKENYDGYHFREDSVGMYNPFSLLNALQKMEFKDYWFETGTPTFLVETLKQNNYELENMTREEVTADLLGSLDSIDQNPLPDITRPSKFTSPIRLSKTSPSRYATANPRSSCHALKLCMPAKTINLSAIRNYISTMSRALFSRCWGSILMWNATPPTDEWICLCRPKTISISLNLR